MKLEIDVHAKKWVAFALLSILVLLIYSNTFQASWHLDDTANIHSNPRIKITNLKPVTLYQTFFASRDGGLYLGKKLYRPLSCLTLALNWYWGKDNVLGYHVVNTAIHILTAFFLFLAVRNLLRSPNLKGKFAESGYFIALLEAALWAINPIQTQAVTYIIQRMASLAAMFYILGIYFYLRGRLSEIRKNQIIMYLCCGASFLLASASKENAITLPLALIVVDIIFFQDLTRPQTRKFLLWGSLIGGVCVAVLGFILFYHGAFASVFSKYSARYFTMSERLMTEPRIVIFYISQIFYPIPSRLSITHDFDISTTLFQPWTTLPAIIIILLLVATGILLMRKSPILSFSILFFFLNHLIESTVLPIELMFEHRNYLPSLFLFLPVAVGIKMLFDYYQKEKRGMYLICVSSFIIVIMALGMGTYIRNLAWATEKTLWEDAMNKAPGMSRPRQNLAWGYYEKINNHEEALRLYEQALDLKDPNPTYSTILAYTNMANIYLKQQKHQKAIEYCQRALNIYPNYIQALKVLTFANLKAGKWEDAAKSAESLYIKHYTNPELIFILSFSLLKVNKYEDALGYLKKLVRREPKNAKLYYNIGVALSKMQKYERAEWFLKTAGQLAPNDILTTFYLIENSLMAADYAGVERYLDRLFQIHSLKDITTFAKGLDETALKISFTPELLAPLIANRIKAKIEELEQLAGT